MPRPPVSSSKGIRCPFRPKRSSTPWWTRPSRFRRSPTPISMRRSTVPCSSTPARTRPSTYSRSRSSRITDSMPWRWRSCPSTRPAGPAPTIPTCVRVTSAGSMLRSTYSSPCEALLSRRSGGGRGPRPTRSPSTSRGRRAEAAALRGYDARRHVLVQREDVIRVVLVLQRHQALELLVAVGRPQSRRALVGADEVRRRLTGGPRAHRLHEGSCPRLLVLGQLRTPPHREAEEEPLGLRHVEGHRARVRAGECPAQRPNDQL